MAGKGITQTDLATHCKVAQGTVSRWIGGTIPPLPTLEKIAKRVDATWQWLLIGDEGIKPLGGLSPRDPIVIKLADDNYVVAKYQRTEEDVSVYEMTSQQRIRQLRVAVALARQQRDRDKL